MKDTTLVETLRGYARPLTEKTLHERLRSAGKARNIYDRAADRIEALEAENERLRVQYISDLSRALGLLEGLGSDDSYLRARLQAPLPSPPREDG